MGFFEVFVLLVCKVKVLLIRLHPYFKLLVRLLPSNGFFHFQPKSIVESFDLRQILWLFFLKHFDFIGMLLQDIIQSFDLLTENQNLILIFSYLVSVNAQTLPCFSSIIIKFLI